DPDPTPEPEPDPEQLINFAVAGVSIYYEDGLATYAESLASRISIYTGVAVTTTLNRAEAKIVFGRMSTDRDFEDVGLLGRYSIKVVDGVLHILASDTKAMQHALNRVYKTVKPGSMKISEAFAEEKLFDNFKSTTSFLIELTEQKVAATALVDRITVNGSAVGGFSPYTNDYIIAFPSLSGYPDISARAVSPNATVSVIQPADNGGTGIIAVTNGSETQVYTVKVSLESVYMNASVINKNNTLGTVTFVIDDGDHNTASFVVNTLLSKYEYTTATFAIYTNQLATLTTNAAGTEYVKDENGKYVYTVNQTNRDFWAELHGTGRIGITSHSHTHQYWGENDDGGSFNYVNNSGTSLVSPSFPKGNVTAELLASQQIVRDLFGDGSNVFVMPGVGAPLSQYYYDLLRNAGYYIAARNTAASVNNLMSMVGLPEHFTDKANRFNIKGYMIEHYNTSPTVPTDKNSSSNECLSAGIPYWTDFIDTAIDAGGWACFCIHNIRPDGYTNTSGEHFIYQSQADALFAHANEYGDSIWVATLEDATKYYNLRAATTVTAELVDNMQMTVALSDSEQSAVYSDVVLTVRVSVPTYWRSASVGDTEYEILEDENGKYVMMNLARGAYVTLKGEGDLGGDEADFEFMPVVGGQNNILALPGSLTLGKTTPLYYNYDDPVSAALAHALAEELSTVSGRNIIPTSDRDIDTAAAHIRIVTPGSLDGIGIALTVKAGSLGAYRIYMNGAGIYISSTDAAALSTAIDRLVDGYADGRLTADAREHYVDANGAEISQDSLADSTALAEITVGGVRLDGFDPDVRAYEVGADLLDGYPTVEYVTYYGGSSVSITLPTAENGGVCRIAVSSESGRVGVYTLRLKSSAKSTGAEIVNKGGADGAVTFVFDDGNHDTALYLTETVLPKYDRVKVTLGIVLNNVCSLVYDEVGDCWMKDVHGNYIYVAKQSEVDFWREIIRCGQVELVSHSYSHAYWGEDDGGG
ncbi:MAG: hypothetical protein IKV43_00930, partial [Clostridia bacterium]|nr:hypothetical protein [Clostridia bacterium]